MGPGPKRPARVLLVEDDVLDAELMLEELNQGGLCFSHECVETEAGFVAALETFHPEVIISDLAMPEFSGYRALELARARAPGVPFLFVSGTMGEDAAIRALQGGATDYVLKHNLARLASAVRRALAEATERQALEQAQEELLRAQRYESLALLASGLSHDLRNVLQPIAMGASMLLEEGDEEARRIGDLIADCTQRGLDIVASMLSFARGAKATQESLEVSFLLDGLAKMLRGTIPDGVELVVAPASPSLRVAGNHTELQQCVLNLALNAVQAMPDGGSLTIAAEARTLEPADFQADEPAAAGRWLVLQVADTGVGMSEETLQRLFRPFFTTKATGTGLGLMSCRRIIENHGGFLRVASQPGVGTTFEVFLPLGTPEPASTPLAPVADGHGERVLVVIERAGKLSLVANLVENAGYAVAGAQDGTVASRWIQDHGLPDAVVMEAPLNLLTGVRTATALLEHGFQGPLLLIARPGARNRDELPPLPRIRFVAKPVDPPDLLGALAEELAVQAGDGAPPQD